MLWHTHQGKTKVDQLLIALNVGIGGRARGSDGPFLPRFSSNAPSFTCRIGKSIVRTMHCFIARVSPFCHEFPSVLHKCFCQKLLLNVFFNVRNSCVKKYQHFVFLIDPRVTRYENSRTRPCEESI